MAEAPEFVAQSAGTVLFGQTRRRVLAWLLGHPDEAFYLRQIVRLTGAALGAVQRELAALTGAGVLRRTVQGRQVYFQANQASSIFPELQALLLKTAGVVDVLRRALAPIADRIPVAFVFGSTARGDLRSDSDIDLLVVGDVPFAVVANALVKAQEQLGRDVTPAVYPAAEFREKLQSGHHFLTTVLSSPRLFVIGGPYELGRLATKRLAEGAQHKRKRDSRAVRRRRTRSRRQRR